MKMLDAMSKFVRYAEKERTDHRQGHQLVRGSDFHS
jgi:hypothetical protein